MVTYSAVNIRNVAHSIEESGALFIIYNKHKILFKKTLFKEKALKDESCRVFQNMNVRV